MKSVFSPSINIIRDTDTDFQYIPTPNTKNIVSQIKEDILHGLRSFTIIGSYGTGKSSFLLALEQTILGVKEHFQTDFLKDSNTKTIKIIGSHKSIIEAFANELNITHYTNSSENIFSEISNLYHDLKGEKPLLCILIDEFGKFLEYAVQNNPEKELYFIQQLSEFVNNSKHKIILITAVHQNFDAYSYSLNKSQRQEWTKIKGRFKEVNFNEPVEQLLYLASEHLSRFSDQTTTKSSIKMALQLFDTSKAFKSIYSKEIAENLYPLDLISANVLTIALQRYGQNERSLFSFLESSESTSLLKYRKTPQEPFYNLAKVFDYLITNFYSFLHTKYNPDSAAWSAIKIAIELAENTFDENLNDSLKLIKTIGLLNIFSAPGAILDHDFLIGYGTFCLGIPNAEERIHVLEEKKIIRFRKHNKKFVLAEESEVDIEDALNKAADKVAEITDIPSVLKKYFEFYPILAKEYSYENGTPRYFQFEISDFPKNTQPENTIDGYINLIFNDKINENLVREAISDELEANIYVYYKNSKEIKNLLYEIEKTQHVLKENFDDRVARRELESILLHCKNLLNHYILTNLFSGSEDIIWIWNKKIQEVDSKKSFNKLLTKVCREVYNKAPKFKNELVNKNNISSSIHTAKKNYFRALVNNWDQPELGFNANKFPPERMIYKSLLQDNKLSPFNDEIRDTIHINENNNFYLLWEQSIEFINSAKQEKKSVETFVEILSKKPFKLKQGLIDFWVPTFLFLKKDDFALFSDSSFIPVISDETLELIAKKPRDFYIKSFDIEGVKLDIFNSYRVFLEQETKDKLNSASFIETIKPFLIFYKTLPDYAKQTGRLSRESILIRDAISKSKDPELTFFESFPTALGMTIKELHEEKSALSRYIITLQDSIREIRTCYDKLVDRFEFYIKHDILFDETLDFEGIKLALQARFRKIKRHLLLPNQKSFIQRIDSSIDEKKLWLSSLCQSLLKKSLENLRDEDEVMLYELFKSMIHDLDNLTELSTVEINEEKEEVYNLQLATFGAEPIKNTIRIPKLESKKIDQTTKKIEEILTHDSETNKVILTKLLQRLLYND